MQTKTPTTFLALVDRSPDFFRPWTTRLIRPWEWKRSRTLPARRIAQATEMVGAAVYLARNEASCAYGTTIPVYGGGSAI